MTHLAPSGPTVPSVAAQSAGFEAPAPCCGNVAWWRAVASHSPGSWDRTTVTYWIDCPCVVEEIA